MRCLTSALTIKHPSEAPCGDLPIEVIEHILIFCRPRDVLAFSSTCRLAHIIVFDFSDQHLWRELFFSQPFDDPRQVMEVTPSGGAMSIDWRHRVIERLEAEWVAKSPPTPNCQTSRALKAFIAMIHDVPPVIQGCATFRSHNLEWLERVLRKTDIVNLEIETPRSEGIPYAQLRAYLALSLEEGEDEKTRLRLAARRKRSRIYVYNVRNYSGPSWGPFLADEKADWIHIEHLINVVLMNLRELPDIWPDIKPPLGLAATRGYSVPINGLESYRDWARVEGTWRRYVSFMDFRDLYAFNFSVNREIDPTLFDCPRFREGTRLLELKLHLIDQQQSRFRDRPWPNSKSINDKYPPIYFAGTSNSAIVGGSAIIEGVVSMSAGGVVRWEFSSKHLGGARWCSDGAQVGHIASAAGVVGVWTTENRCNDDTVGPFWLWKVRHDYPIQLFEFSR